MVYLNSDSIYYKPFYYLNYLLPGKKETWCSSFDVYICESREMCVLKSNKNLSAKWAGTDLFDGRTPDLKGSAGILVRTSQGNAPAR